ncbi:MAG TPA: response regulator [Holophaga sp.]|nr:response regulator [Holophaga sp.]
MKHGAYLEAVLDAFEATTPHSCFVSLVNQGGEYVIEASRGEGAPEPGRRWPVAAFRLRPWETFTPPWDEASAGAWIAIPIDLQGETLGWMVLQGGAGKVWREEELRSIRSLARLASLTLGNRRFRLGAQEKLTRFSILVRIGHALASNLELEPLLETVHKEVGRLFDATNFFVALYRVQASEWEWTFQVEHGRRQPRTRHTVGEGLTGYILRSGKPLLFSTVADKRAFLAREGVVSLGEPSRSWMGVPLSVGDLVVGVMVIQHYEEEGVYSMEDLELFQTIASQLAVAVRNAQLYEDAGRRALETEIVNTIGRDIMASLDVETVLARIASSVRSLLTQDSLGIFLEREEPDVFPAAAVSGLEEAALKAHAIRRGVGILGSVIERGKAEIINDASEDPRTIHIQDTSSAEKGEKLLAAPLSSADRVIGVIAVWRSPEEPPFDGTDLAFLEGIARQASVALRNAYLFGKARSAQAEAETASRAKSSFLASMSHELRTPLNAILLYSELLMDEVTERGIGELISDLDKIQGAGKHLLGLIDDILDLSKIEAGRMSLCIETCDLPSLLAEVSATAESLAARNGNCFLLDRDPSLLTLDTDQKKLRQMLFNLLSNASKFTQDGTISLRVSRDPGDVHRACFLVSDTGIGMSLEQQERVFQEFAQAEESTSRKYGGTGLGLALCRKFADLLGGEIRVESQLGKGATFRLSIPGLPVPSPAAGPLVPVPGGAGRGRILMIDDDPSLRDALSRMLAKDGFQIALANNGLDGLKLAKSLLPRLITLDIAMPGCDGWEVLTRLKADPELKHIPVVVITILDDRAKGFALEASDYLQKPVSRERLLAVVHRLVPDEGQAPVLIVEDDEATREGLQRILAAEGMATRTSEDGIQALAFLRDAFPGLILLDLMMPGMDGFQLLEEIKKDGNLRRIPVVVMTAMTMTPEVEARLKLPQVHQVIQKGAYSRSELVEVVRRHALRNVGESVPGPA